MGSSQYGNLPKDLQELYSFWDATDTLIAVNDDQVTTSSNSFVKIKQYTITKPIEEESTFTLSLDFKNWGISAPDDGHFKVYLNDDVLLWEEAPTSGDWETFTEDVELSPDVGDTIDLWIKTYRDTGSGFNVSAKNFRIYASQTPFKRTIT